MINVFREETKPTQYCDGRKPVGLIIFTLTGSKELGDRLPSLLNTIIACLISDLKGVDEGFKTVLKISREEGICQRCISTFQL